MFLPVWIGQKSPTPLSSSAGYLARPAASATLVHGRVHPCPLEDSNIECCPCTCSARNRVPIRRRRSRLEQGAYRAERRRTLLPPCDFEKRHDTHALPWRCLSSPGVHRQP